MVRQGGGGSPHVDVSEATRLTMMALTQAQQPQSKKGISGSGSGAGIAAVSVSASDDVNEGLMSVPCYLSLCLHDLVTTACACATFTVDDHLVSSRQNMTTYTLTSSDACMLTLIFDHHASYQPPPSRTLPAIQLTTHFPTTYFFSSSLTPLIQPLSYIT